MDVVEDGLDWLSNVLVVLVLLRRVVVLLLEGEEKDGMGLAQNSFPEDDGLVLIFAWQEMGV